MTAEEEKKLLKYIVLTEMKGLGPVTHNALLDICGDIESCFEADYDDLVNADQVKSNEIKINKNRIKSFITHRKDRNLWIQADEILCALEATGTHVVTYDEKQFPNRFRNIKDITMIL